VEHGGHVHGDDRVPALSGKILDVGNKLNTGVVHQDVQRAEFGLGLHHHRSDLLRSRDVGAGIADAYPMFRSQGRALRLNAAGIAEAVQHYVGTSRGQDTGDAVPDPAGRASDQSCPAFQAHGARPSVAGRAASLADFCCAAQIKPVRRFVQDRHPREGGDPARRNILANGLDSRFRRNDSPNRSATSDAVQLLRTIAQQVTPS
jgi:hypothetical protein